MMNILMVKIQAQRPIQKESWHLIAINKSGSYLTTQFQNTLHLMASKLTQLLVMVKKHMDSILSAYLLMLK